MTWDYVGLPWFRPALIGLHLLLLALLAALGVGWWREAPALRRWIGAAVGFSVAWLLLVPRTALEGWIDPLAFQPLQESDAAGLWGQMLGNRGHIGPGWSRLLADLLPRGAVHPARWVAFQLWFLPPLLALQALAVRALARSGWAALVLTAALLATPAFRIALWSDQFVVAPSVLVVAGVLPLAVATDPARPRRRRLLGIAALAVLVPVLWTYRIESAGLPLAGLVGAVLGLVVPVAWRARAADAVGRWTRRPSNLLIGALALGVWGAAAWRFGEDTAPWRLATAQQWSWLLVAVWPLNAAWTLLPPVLAGALGLGLGGLALVGLARAVVALPLRTGLVGFAVVVLFQAYYASAHGMVPARTGLTVAWWELYRYLFNLHVVFVLLAALAWPALTAGEGGASRPLVAVVTLFAFLPPLAVVPAWLGAEPRDAATVAPVRADVDEDPQRFYRWFQPRFAAEPDCVWVTQTRRWGGLYTTTGERMAWAVLHADARKGHQIDLRPIDLGPREAALDVVPGATCAWLVASPDCSLVDDTRCLADAATLPEVERETWTHRPFVHPQHGFLYRSEITIGRWRLVP